jgi:ribosomal-protein-serine acetyltransferase
MSESARPQPEIILRPFEKGDADSFAAAARESVASVGRWMSWCHDGFSVDEAHAWFATCAQTGIEGTGFEFGVFGPDGKELLGGAGLNQFNWQHNLANLGYWVRTTHQRRGIATGVALALAKFGFETLSLGRIEIVTAVGNEASESVARKIGARFECIARNRLVLHGKSVAARVYSLVPTDIDSAGSVLGYDVEVRSVAVSAPG